MTKATYQKKLFNGRLAYCVRGESVTIIASSRVTGRQGGAGSSIAGSVVTDRQKDRQASGQAGSALE